MSLNKKLKVNELKFKLVSEEEYNEWIENQLRDLRKLQVVLTPKQFDDLFGNIDWKTNKSK